MHIEFLLEESSMQNVIEVIFERLQLGDKHTVKFHPHHGKDHLLRRLPQKLRGYRSWITDDYLIVIVVDQDRDDCLVLKQKVVQWCVDTGLEHQVIIRIAVIMLESWFLGDIEALETAFPKLKRAKLGNKKQYRDPEARDYPVDDLDREMKNVGYFGYAKGIHSREIAPHLNLDIEHNRSTSFNVFLHTMLDLINIDHYDSNL